MKWVIITGTWRSTNKEVEDDVRQAARKIYEDGNGLVTGGATGVDYFAMHEFFKLNPDCTRMRTFIPAKLYHYIKDYRQNWKQSPIIDDDIDNLSNLLNIIKTRNPGGFFEGRKNFGDVTQDDYNIRNAEEVNFSDELCAFRVNDSIGTGDTIGKAEAAGLRVVLYKKYRI